MRRASLVQNVRNDFSRDVGQAVVSSIKAIGEFRVFKSEQPQQGRMQVVHMDFVVLSLVAKFVRGSIVEATLDASSGQPDGESVRVMIASLGSLRIGCPAKLA